MAIDSNFINKLPDNVLMAEKHIIETFYKTLEVYSMSDDKSGFYEDFIELYSFYQVYAEKHTLDVAFPKLGTNVKNNLELIISFFRNRHRIVAKKVEKFANDKIMDDKKSMFKSILYDDYVYHFETEELKELRFFLHQLRAAVNETQHLKSKYIKRLTKKIDSITKDLVLEMQSLDPIWGLIGEAGIIVGKTGSKCDKIVSKIREIIHKIWHVQARSEEIDKDKIPVMVVSYKEPEKEK